MRTKSDVQISNKNSAEKT